MTNAVHPIKPGDIFYTSWGYDQTNVDFYQIVSLSGKTGVKVRQIGATVTSDHGAGGSRVIADPSRVCGEIMTKRLKCYTYNGEKWAFKVASYANAYQWDGMPKHCTSYGWGH